VKEEFEEDVERMKYFVGKKPDICLSRVLQVNNTDIYIIGGHKKNPLLLARDYKVRTSCLHLNM
jgi:hypothetical protein